MIDIKSLVPQLQKQVELLTEDLIAQSRNVASVESFLRENHTKLLEAERFSQSYEEWSEDYLEQVAVSWVLACVFVRFLEDNHLIDECWIAGEADRGKLADGSYEIFFRRHPHDTDREYLKFVFREIGKIPATKELFDEEKVTLWAVDPSGDAVRRLLLFFKEIDPERGGLKRQFDTREVRTSPLVDVYEQLAPQAQFLGDLYQDLSEHARKKYALLQTPEFVQQFILDRTLNEAIDEFGLKGLRLIDPACGSGHFLLGAFDRLFSLWMASDEIRGNPVVAAQNAFDSLFGVDINPFAIAITRFRMLVAAVRACGIRRIHQQSYAWKLNLAMGDSLIRGSRPTFDGGRDRILTQREFEFDPAQDLRIEDVAEANRILDQGYHVVVGNPPYIIVRDRAQNALYRQIYSTCHQKYSLGVPFTQRFWDLTIRKAERVNSNADAASPTAGYIGMITANSFMKREFGKKLVEDFFPKSPKVDLTHVIDTSGAYIPGHGTPTVILLGRARKPVGETVRAVLGIKGEPATPDDPAQGFVWQSILRHIDMADAKDEFTSSADVPRTTFNVHPWSIGGGGAAELMEMISERGIHSLGELSEAIGPMAITALDDVFLASEYFWNRRDIDYKEFLTGETVRDWRLWASEVIAYPYDSNMKPRLVSDLGKFVVHLWPYKNLLESRLMFGKTQAEADLAWFEYRYIEKSRAKAPMLIVFPCVATHNHFAVTRSSIVANRHAPVVKLSAEATEDDHLAMLGLLNSSTACFWMKQVFYPKATAVGDISTEKGKPEANRYEFTGTGLLSFPVPGDESKTTGLVLEITREIELLARKSTSLMPKALLAEWHSGRAGRDLADQLAAAERDHENCKCRMIALQEELDWEVYRAYSLTEKGASGQVLNDRLRGIAAEDRPFSWGTDQAPVSVPDAWRSVYEERRRLLTSDPNLKLIETVVFKRPWWGRQGVYGQASRTYSGWVVEASRDWLLDRLGGLPYWSNSGCSEPFLRSTAQLADQASGDAEFLQVAAIYRGRPDFDVTALVLELVEAESVPFLPVLRYKPSGLRKREVWEHTWDLQRQEDAGQDVGDIPVPPKYTSADFLKQDYWRLRGKLDVPKERWISYPHLQTESDPSLVVGWAGWDHLQQASALIASYDARKREGWDARRLTPILAGLDQLLPWIHQWHSEIDPEFGDTAGQSYQALLENDAHELGLTLNDIRNWQPPQATARRRARKG